jgi:xanthosine utilization system XapX-like protein
VKFLFLPVSIVLGLVAGLLGRKIFEQAWGLIDDEEPPDAKHREISVPKLLAALAVEGAIFRLVKGLTDHGARRGYARMTGTWPGEEAPEPE